MNAPIRVGIGLVARDGRYLIRQRPELPGSPMPGYWEFAGGKCEPGETAEEAARRECGEEIGVPVRVRRLRQVITHQYPHGLVELYYFDCELADPTAEPSASSGFRWVEAQDLPAYRFPGANEPVVEDLVREARAGPGPG
jgi:8-oxo-dGTP diphosphatase